MTGVPLLSTAFQLVWPSAVHPCPSDREEVRRIRRLAAPLARESDRALQERAAELRDAAGRGEAVLSPGVLPAAFELVVEAVRRTLGIELYDVQLLGGMALARGSIAEIETGEGKTFVAALPAFLHGLSGRGVHVMTVNSYLAGRDYELLAPVYRRLGLTVGLLEPEADAARRRAAYGCDVTYGPGYEFGFDYLRDQVALLSERKPKLGERFRDLRRGKVAAGPVLRQRGHAVAIVDEADSVMLDEATTPLILAAGGSRPADNADVYRTALDVAGRLEQGEDFVVDEPERSLQLTRQGLASAQSESHHVRHKRLERPWPVYVEQALCARRLFHRDVHYVVRDDHILLVDDRTGRILPDRSWRDGLQQAVEAKEGVTITTETQSVARITRQRYFRLYGHLCGMTGTARGSERELRDVYRREVAVIPPHRPCQRTTLPPRFFSDVASKEREIVDEVVRLWRSGQPVLVGTVSIEMSERIAGLLDRRSVAYQLLNGKQDAEEAAVVARAGQIGAVTIATNMAGRGTDIKLGPGVPELGGLHVIATEPQESTRAGRQLVGRAARQGDPGSCRLFASADDTLIARHAPALARRMRRLAGASGEIRADLSGEIASLERAVERRHARLRRRMFDHDDWLESAMRELVGGI